MLMYTDKYKQNIHDNLIDWGWDDMNIFSKWNVNIFIQIAQKFVHGYSSYD